MNIFIKEMRLEILLEYHLCNQLFYIKGFSSILDIIRLQTIDRRLWNNQNANITSIVQSLIDPLPPSLSALLQP